MRRTRSGRSRQQANLLAQLLQRDPRLRRYVGRSSPVVNAISDIGNIPKEVFDALQEPAIQDGVFAAVVQYYGLGTSPEEMYKPEFIQYLLNKKSADNQLLILGAYESPFTPPPADILPDQNLTVEKLSSELKSLQYGAELENLDGLLGYYEEKLGPVINFFKLK